MNRQSQWLFETPIVSGDYIAKKERWDWRNDRNSLPSVEGVGRSRGNAPGNNQNQNSQIDSLVKKYGLTNKQRERLHKRIRGQGYSYQEIKNIIQSGDYFETDTEGTDTRLWLFEVPSSQNADYMSVSLEDSLVVDLKVIPRSLPVQFHLQQKQALELAKTNPVCAGCDYERLVKKEFKLMEGKQINAVYPDAEYRGFLVEITLAQKMNDRKMRQLEKYLESKGKLLVIKPRSSGSIETTMRTIGEKVKKNLINRARNTKQKVKFNRLIIRIWET